MLRFGFLFSLTKRPITVGVCFGYHSLVIDFGSRNKSLPLYKRMVRFYHFDEVKIEYVIGYAESALFIGVSIE